MITNKEIAHPAIRVVTDHVANQKQSQYEKHVGELHKMLKQQPGFLSVDTVRHEEGHQTEYTVLLRFADSGSATAWKSEPKIRAKLDEVHALTGGPAKIVEAAGLEMWVDHEPGEEALMPPFWKRVLLSVLAVYPSIMLLMEILDPLIGALPQAVQVLVLVIVLSAFLTWPIMPALSHLLGPWLKSSKN